MPVNSSAAPQHPPRSITVAFCSLRLANGRTEILRCGGGCAFCRSRGLISSPSAYRVLTPRQLARVPLISDIEANVLILLVVSAVGLEPTTT